MSETQTKSERRKADEDFRKNVLVILQAQKRVIGALSQAVSRLQEQVAGLQESSRMIH